MPFEYESYDSVVPSFPIDLDKRRHVRLRNRAIFRAEIELSKLWGRKVSLFQTLGNSETLGFNDLSVILWQGLLHEDPRLTLEQTQDIMDLGQLPTIIDVILQAWNAATAPAVPESMSNGEAPADPFPAGLPGTPSGPMAVLS
jgi:hypothetical protein